MFHCIIVFVGGILLLFAGNCALAAEKDSPSLERGRKPNILVIFTDDHGWADLGVHGADQDIHTPNLDQLARDGVLFLRGYVTAPQCVPSRAGLITGTHQNRFGVEDNLKGPLPLEVTTLPERLKRAGYVTGMVGKWHLDLVRDTKAENRNQRMDPRFLPHAHGFDEFWCGNIRAYHASHSLDGTPLPNPPQLVEDPRFRITVQTEAALSFLNRRAQKPDEPWFLYLAWFAPHVPLESPEPWFSRTPAHLPKERRQALAMIAAMDEGLGAIREKIRAMGQEENTLIFFISDNGAPIRPGAWNGSLNTPLVGEKGMLTDGGVRVPFIAAWPGEIPAGQVFQHPVSSLDVAATAVALAGLPHDDQLDGVNLMPYLLGENDGPPHDALFWRWRSQGAVLEFPWKLIRLGADQRFLFNVTEPQGETVNLIGQYPEIAARLEQKLNLWETSLARPGGGELVNPQDRYFFDTHVLKSPPSPPQDRRHEASLQGWIVRNGTVTVENGALVIMAKEQGRNAARPFLTRTGLNLTGPVTVSVTLRSETEGEMTFSWRTSEEKDFQPKNRVTIRWSSNNKAAQTIQARLPVVGPLIHIRIQPAEIRGLAIERITLHSEDGQEQTWSFGNI
ncbi:MAG: sulfatase family protein [Thermogutta sp.]